MITLKTMDKIEAFNGLDEDQLKSVQRYCKTMQFNEKDRLFKEGDDAAVLWIIIKGKMDMRFDLPSVSTSKENTIATIEPYQAFGWSCFVTPYKYRLSAYCSTKTCEVIKIDKNRIERLFKKDTHIGYCFMSYLVNVVGIRFHQLQNEVAEWRGEDIISGW